MQQVLLLLPYKGGISRQGGPHSGRRRSPTTEGCCKPSTASRPALRSDSAPIRSSSRCCPTKVAELQWEKLLDVIEPIITSTTGRSLTALIRDFTGRPSQLALDTKIKLLARPICDLSRYAQV